jgi:hypothetical protein
MICNAVGPIILYNVLKCALPTDFLNVRKLMEDIVSENETYLQKGPSSMGMKLNRITLIIIMIEGTFHAITLPSFQNSSCLDDSYTESYEQHINHAILGKISTTLHLHNHNLP